MTHYTLNQVIKAIDKAKAQLITQAKAHGLVEDFGQQAARNIKTKYCPSDWYNFYHDRKTALEAEMLVQRFSDWASNFSTWDLLHGNFFMERL